MELCEMGTEEVLATHVLRLEAELRDARTRIVLLENAIVEESYTRRAERDELQRQLDVLAAGVAELIRSQVPMELPAVSTEPPAPTIHATPYREHDRARRVDGGRVLRAIRGAA